MIKEIGQLEVQKERVMRDPTKRHLLPMCQCYINRWIRGYPIYECSVCGEPHVVGMMKYREDSKTVTDGEVLCAKCVIDSDNYPEHKFEHGWEDLNTDARIQIERAYSNV